MSCILHIETSTSACSVAVSEDGQNVFKKECLRVIRRHLLFFRSHHRLLETGLGSINKRVSYRNDMEQKVTNTNGKRIEIPARTPEL